jgi:hypothetical protein
MPAALGAAARTTCTIEREGQVGQAAGQITAVTHNHARRDPGSPAEKAIAN